MELKKAEISLEKTYYLKGVAILMIIIHNFCHQKMKIENEHYFSLDNTIHFFRDLLFSEDSLYAFFSYFGHLGIIVFIFLSGYGLSKKYDDLDIPIKDFLVKHAKKLWRLIIPIALASSVARVVLLKESLVEHLIRFISAVTFSTKLIRTQLYYGPWWFFTLIFELYIVYLLTKKYKANSLLYLLSVFSILLQLLFIHSHCIIWIRYNCFGFLLPFCLGIFFSRNSIMFNKQRVCIYSLFFFILSNFNEYLWLFQPISICLPLLLIDCALFNKLFVKIGKISMYLFVTSAMIYVHGLVSFVDDKYLRLICFIIEAFTLAWLYKLAIDSVIRVLSNIMNRK